MGVRRAERINRQNGQLHGYFVKCPACKDIHVFDKRWTFNDNFEKHTFKPSMLIHADGHHKRCHSFVADGKIRRLGDCEHDMKNTTMELDDVDAEWDGETGES